MSDTSPPSDWLVAHASHLPPGGGALDLACGRGRHARWLAARGFHVHAVDRHAEAIHALNAHAREQGWPILGEVVDLEVPGVTLERDRYDVIVGVHYLHRPLFASLLAALRPQGVLVYETFTRAQARHGRPTNPAFLLEPGELRVLTADLTMLDYREGAFGGRDIASIVCRKETLR